MRHAIISVVILTLLFLITSKGLSQEQDFESILRFEQFEGAGESETLPGWRGGPAETIHFDSTIVHSGIGAARLDRDEVLEAALRHILSPDADEVMIRRMAGRQ